MTIIVRVSASMNRHRDRRGQSLVEFALILPIFVLMLVGIFDFGRAIYAFNTISQAAREGARLAIVDQTISHIQDEASESSVSLGIDPADVIVDFRDRETPDDAGFLRRRRRRRRQQRPVHPACMAVVTVPYEYEAVTPFLGALLGTIQTWRESRASRSTSTVKGPSARWENHDVQRSSLASVEPSSAEPSRARSSSSSRPRSIGLIAMVGLVIDGGYAWGRQRITQNGADAIAKAGSVVILEWLDESRGRSATWAARWRPRRRRTASTSRVQFTDHTGR